MLYISLNPYTGETFLYQYVLSSSQAKHFSVSPVTKAAPEVEQAGHDHVMHWTAERILSVVLVGAIPAAVAIPHPAMEYLLALSMTVHSHWFVITCCNRI